MLRYQLYEAVSVICLLKCLFFLVAVHRSLRTTAASAGNAALMCEERRANISTGDMLCQEPWNEWNKNRLNVHVGPLTSAEARTHGYMTA